MAATLSEADSTESAVLRLRKTGGDQLPMLWLLLFTTFISRFEEQKEKQ
jgi:hypothetical protein